MGRRPRRKEPRKNKNEQTANHGSAVEVPRYGLKLTINFHKYQSRILKPKHATTQKFQRRSKKHQPLVVWYIFRRRVYMYTLTIMEGFVAATILLRKGTLSIPHFYPYGVVTAVPLLFCRECVADAPVMHRVYDFVDTIVYSVF